MAHNDVMQHLLTAYNILAPNSRDQQAIARTVSEMRRGGSSDREICRAITGHLYDGLAYGNWPSAIEAAKARS